MCHSSTSISGTNGGVLSTIGVTVASMGISAGFSVGTNIDVMAISSSGVLLNVADGVGLSILGGNNRKIASICIY